MATSPRSVFVALCLWFGHAALTLVAASQPITLTYKENGTLLFSESRDTIGCFADLGSYPHWCLGNLSRCDDGVTVSLWLKPSNDVSPEDGSDIVLTSGGHSDSQDNGFYIKRYYGDQYTLGFALGQDAWTGGIRLISGSWIHISMAWSEDQGLHVHVDGFQALQVQNPRARVLPLSWGSSSVMTGLRADDDAPLISSCRFGVKDVTVVDTFETNEADILILYQGCISSVNEADFQIDANSDDPIQVCRQECWQTKQRYALVKGNSSCACRDEVKDMELSDPNCDGKWQVYTVSHLETSHDFVLTLQSQSLSKNAYIKPKEDIMFYASINYNLDLAYRVEFDDGIVVTTATFPITHAWAVPGNHIVEVSVWIGQIELKEKIDVNVDDVDEGTAPDVVGLTVGHVEDNDTTALCGVRTMDEHRTTCGLSFGDGTNAQLLPIDDFGGSRIMTHEYAICGFYTVGATCGNMYGNTSSKVDFMSKILDTSYHFISSKDNFSIPVYGTDRLLSHLTVGDGRQRVSFMIDGKDNVLVQVRDLISGADNILEYNAYMTVMDRHVLRVREPVTKPFIVGHTTAGSWNLTSSFAITLATADHYWIDINYGNGSPSKQMYVDHSDVSLQVQESAFYPDVGYYKVVIELYNEISNASRSLDVSVEVPIDHLNVSASNITNLQENVTFFADVNAGQRGPQKVDFVIDYGDGNVENLAYTNNNSEAFDTFHTSHKYVNWGIYRVTVRAVNNVSEAVVHLIVQVGENMTFLDILTDSERAAVDGPIVFNVNCPTGSDVSYTVDFGDGTNYTLEELQNAPMSADTKPVLITQEGVTVSHFYRQPGKYNVHVLAVNDFGALKANLCPTIRIVNAKPNADCSNPTVSFKDLSTSVSNPLVRKRSEKTTIEVEYAFSCNLNDTKPTFSWKGYVLEDEGKSNLTQKTIFQYCGYKLPDKTLTIEPLALPFGLYKLSVTVSPEGNDLIYATSDLYIEIIQSEPVPMIAGEEERTIMRYEEAIFDFSDSHDPDIVENRRKDLSFHLFFMPVSFFKESKTFSLESMINASDFVMNKTLYRTTTANPLHIYQRGVCFNESTSVLYDLSAFNGRVNFAGDNFVTDQFSFGIILWVERNYLTAMTSQIVDVRSSNMSLSDLGSLLDLAKNADPDTAIRLCGNAADAILTQDASSADEQEKLAESTEAVVSTLGSVAKRIDSPNQASKCASAIKAMTRNKDIVSEGSRASAADAFVNLANGSSSMEEATVEDVSTFAGEALGGLGNIFPTSVEEKKGPRRRSKNEEVTTTTELLGLMSTVLANSTDDFGFTQPFTTQESTEAPATTPSSPTTTYVPPMTTTEPHPETTVQTVITTESRVIIHTTVGTTMVPEIRTTFVDNGDNYTISGITVATLQVNASKDYITTPMPFTTTESIVTTTEAPTTPVTIPIHPRMFDPRTDERTSYEIADDILNNLPEKIAYDELLDYIFDDCLLFRKVMKTPDIQHNCPCISAEAINMMKCDGDFSLQDRVFDIMTYYEHPDDLYEAYLVPLNKARRIRDRKRKETDALVATSGQNALGTVADSVGGKTSEDDKTERSFSTPRLGMKVAKVGVSNSTNTTAGAAKGQAMDMPVGGFNMPSNVLGKSSGGCSNVNTLFLGDTDNPFTYSEEKSSVGKGVLSLGYSCNGEKVKVEGAEEPIELWMERDANSYQSSLFVLLTNTKKDVWTNFNYHPVNLTENNGSLQVVIEPSDPFSEYYVYMKYGDRPNMTHYDFIGSSPDQDVEKIPGFEALNYTQQEQLRYSVTMPLELTQDNGTYWIGIKFKSGNIEVEETTVNTSYSLLHLISGCRFWDDTNNTWSSEGCQVGLLTTKYKTQCFCDHLTSFGSDAAVAPNTIDFSNVWAKFDLTENASVFSTVIVLIGLYLILLIWLRHMDKKDLVKWGALPLEDNLPTDNYHYQVTIQTGVRKHAGTESQVRFIVSGEDSDTGVRRLSVADGQRKHLPRGSILNYVMSVESALGPLTFLRIWHDNSGKGYRKSWYLDQVQVNDLQTGEKFIFLCDQWLAVEQDDGLVDRILPVAGVDDLVAFKQLFSSSARKKLANDHIWFSIFSRPTRSNFTRVQRLSCCMSLLFLTMITNAMWFKSDGDQKNVEAIKLGPFSFTLAQFFISFASTMIVFPVNFIMMTFFRRCRPKNNAIAQVNQVETKDKQKFRWKNVSSNSMVWGARAKKGRMQKFKESVANILSLHKSKKYTDTIEEELQERENNQLAKPKKKKTWSLPHWCIYIAWILCFFSIVASGFFTILYSMEWGKEKSNEWLTNFLLSFFQSVIIVQPIKVLLLVAFIACILKKPELDEEDLDEDLNKVLAGGKACPDRDETSLSQIMLQRRTENSEFQPPDPAELAQSRQQRIMEMKMEAVLKEIVIYFLFLGIIFFLSYQQRDPQSYVYGDHIRKSMMSGFSNVKTVLDYWVWLEGTFMPAFYAMKYANRTPVHYWQDAACISDLESRRVGVARLRQMRIKNDTCTILPSLKGLINHCRDEYSWTDDDTKPYLPYWVTPPSYMEDRLEDSESPFVYQSSMKLKNAPYVGTLATYKGGGYVILTKRKECRARQILKQARSQNWLDLNTKAIFLEYTVYNPNSNLFASVTALTEFLTTGSTTQRVEVKVFRLMSYIGGFGLIVLIMEVFFAIFSIYFFYQCIKKLKANRLKYFKDFWNLLEFVLLCFAIACIVLYAFKHILTEVAMRALHDRKSDGFVNFNSIALYDEMYGYIMAVVVFMATIQFLKLLQFNKKMGMLGATVKLATKDLKVFSVAFLLYFFAFSATAFLLFGSAMMSYQNLITSTESMFAFALGSFDYEAMTRVQPFWGPLFFFSYIGVVYIGLMSIFLTIIGDSFTQVKENVALQSNDYEIVDFMWKKVKALFK